MANDMTTVVTSFDDQDAAGQAMEALQKEGFAHSILEGSGDKLIQDLAERGFSKDDAREFADAAEQGKTLVAVEVAEDKADQAASIMERFEVSQDSGDGSTETLPIVEEELSVEKGKTVSGGVRATTTVKETPVEKTVTLKDEKVSAERKGADRTLGADEAKAAFEEKTVEMMGTTETAEVQKQARVVGEVALNKETSEHEETVRDTLRKTDVSVEEVKATSGKRK
jgi:stress response protein YsnF